MSAECESEDSFPEVSVSKRAAIMVMVGLVVLYTAAFYAFSMPAELPLLELTAGIVFASMLLTLSYIDLRTGLLPDILTLPLIALGIGFGYFVNGELGLALLSALIGYVLIAALSFGWKRWRGYEGIGLGDAKLLAACGAWTGFFSLPEILLVASAMGLVGALFVSQKARSSDELVAIPFGPCLAFGGWITWCGLETIIPV